MPLVLIPVLLIAGALFIYLGVHGLPVFTPAAEYTGSTAYVSQGALLLDERRGRSSGGRALPAPTITQADVILADVLTEMLELREQFAELSDRVAAMTSGLNQLAAERAPRKRKSGPAA
jgi:hypothetical protein